MTDRRSEIVAAQKRRWAREIELDVLAEANSPVNQLLAEPFGWQHHSQQNMWGGLDWHLPSGESVRICPVDGEWEAGYEVHVFTETGVNERSVKVADGVFDCDQARAIIEAVRP